MPRLRLDSGSHGHGPPFKLSETTIVIVKALPVLQCEGCSEYALEDQVMERVDAILERADPSVELEIIRYAA
jgi:hypothetical protein